MNKQSKLNLSFMVA